MSGEFTFETSRGPTAGVLDAPAGASAVVVLGHGAGSGMASPFMTGIAGALAGLGLAVARFDFAYMHAGRKAPDRPQVLLETWRLARDAVAERTDGLPLVVGGKSLGGRIASMAVAEGMAAEALVFLGYPLHPPGRTDKLRRDHLGAITAPMLFLQGSRDAFAQPDLLAETVGSLGDRATLVEVEGGDHSFRVPGGPRDGAAIGAGLAHTVADFVRRQCSRGAR
jgi:predicted alpha/beta-hydrolase family hydrolase